MIAMPEIATHRYNPGAGPCLNMCALTDDEALRVLDRLRREFRPTLKPDYLARRRATEFWLTEAATGVFGKPVRQRPTYFFLGNFSHAADPSRPAALVVPIAQLPLDAITFTLGDSMSVAERPARRVYKLDEMVALFVTDPAIAEFGLCDQDGFQTRFIELQLWDSFSLRAHESEAAAANGSATM